MKMKICHKRNAYGRLCVCVHMEHWSHSIGKVTVTLLLFGHVIYLNVRQFIDLHRNVCVFGLLNWIARRKKLDACIPMFHGFFSFVFVLFRTVLY